MKTDEMKSSYIILPEKELILEVLIGEVNIENIKTHRDILYSEKKFKPSYNIILDTTDAKINFGASELMTYMKYLAASNVFATRKTAILAKESNKERFSEAFNAFKGKFPADIEVFSKLSECMEWIKKNHISISEKEVTKEFETLKNDPHYRWFKEPNSITGF